MKANSTMTRDVTVVGPACPLIVAWQIMREQRIRHLPIVEAMRLVGILSDRDILLRATATGDGTVDVPREPVALAMTPAPVTCLPETSVGWMAQTMINHRIDAVPVVDRDGTLAGLVTSTDLLALLIDYEEGALLPFRFSVHDAERTTEAG
jgi:CBS domain-containing protein